jgi:hypothetical protein
MGFGMQAFVVDGDDITPLINKDFWGFAVRRAATLPQYAGRDIDIAAVYYDLNGRKPERIWRVDYGVYRVTDTGALDREHMYQQIAKKLCGSQYPNIPIEMDVQPLHATGVAGLELVAYSPPHILSTSAKAKILQRLFA